MISACKGGFGSQCKKIMELENSSDLQLLRELVKKLGNQLVMRELKTMKNLPVHKKTALYFNITGDLFYGLEPGIKIGRLGYNFGTHLCTKIYMLFSIVHRKHKHRYQAINVICL